MTGTTETLSGLMARHEAGLRHMAARILHDAEEARDVVQESFMALDAVLGGLESRSIPAWLVKTTTRKALDRRRVQGRRPRSLLGSADGNLIDSRRPEYGPERREDAARIERALTALSPRQAEVIRARLINRTSFVAIAADLAISQGAAKTHFSRGLRRLRRDLSENGDDHETR